MNEPRTKVSACIGLQLFSVSVLADAKGHAVSSKNFVDAWPFTVDSVDLMCEGPSSKALARTSDGTVYSLNGSARSIAKTCG
ncbi:DUF2511 domain-containing protein [Pseudomonas sp. SDO5522_S412]